MSRMTFYVIYDHPRDYPDDVVCRRQFVEHGKITCDRSLLLKGPSVEQVRERLLKKHPGLNQFQGGDPDPHIAEVWF